MNGNFLVIPQPTKLTVHNMFSVATLSFVTRVKACGTNTLVMQPTEENTFASKGRKDKSDNMRKGNKVLSAIRRVNNATYV